MRSEIKKKILQDLFKLPPVIGNYLYKDKEKKSFESMLGEK